MSDLDVKQCLYKNKLILPKQPYHDKTEPIKLYTWRKLREAYVKQAMLVRKVDEALGNLIILSCLSNYYFICLELFLGITQNSTSNTIKQLSNIISLAWLCVRVSSVVLAAADINIHFTKALKYIYSYDTHWYNIEVMRLQNQLSKDYVALSEKGLFYLNRTILLQMAGAVLTYVLFLFSLMIRVVILMT